MNAILRSFVDWYRALAAGWRQFWFTPADPTRLAIIRILAGSMLVYTHVVWGLDLEAFFGSTGWLSADVVHQLQRDQYVLSYWWLIPDQWMWFAHWMAVAIFFLFTVGVWTRITSILAFVITVSYAHRVPGALFGLDQINAMLALYPAIGPSGSALSADRLFARWRSLPATDLNVKNSAPEPRVSANLALRLIQVHLCIIYLFAGLSKLQGTAWWSGEAMWLAFANLEYQSRDMTWLAFHPWLINLMTHVALIWEITFCVLVWRPLLRPLVLALGVILHIGIGACLGMWTFGLVMTIPYLAFVPESLVKRLVYGRCCSGVSGNSAKPAPEVSK